MVQQGGRTALFRGRFRGRRRVVLTIAAVIALVGAGGGAAAVTLPHHHVIVSAPRESGSASQSAPTTFGTQGQGLARSQFPGAGLATSSTAPASPGGTSTPST